MKFNLKNSIVGGEIVIGGWLTTCNAIVAEAMGQCDFDWVAVDMEHGPADELTIPSIFMALELNKIAPIVRLPSSDPYLGRRMLDLGAAGLIVPVVESVEKFNDFIEQCLYPPNGRRGVGLSRANGWGDNFVEYFNGFKPIIFPQIETKKGVEASDSLAMLSHVDGLFIGPYDLSADLGIPGDFESLLYTNCLKTIQDACGVNGKACGFHQVDPSIAQLRKKIDEGFKFIAYGTDMIAMRYTFNELSKLK